LRSKILEGIGLKDMTLYGLGALKPQNIALLGIMRANVAETNIRNALSKGVPVVHAWGEHGTVSPEQYNLEIAEAVVGDAPYAAVRILGEEADHSITNRYALNARLARMSLDMLKLSR
jgi:hypothetical protein